MIHIREIYVSAFVEMHIWTKHCVTPEEVEEVCFSDPLVIRGRNNSYAVYGRTEAGRYLIVFLYPQGRGVFRLASAREMATAEKRRYQRDKER